jgi:hypothetical protein
MESCVKMKTKEAGKTKPDPKKVMPNIVVGRAMQHVCQIAFRLRQM